MALVALVIDGTKTIAASAWVATPLGQYWFDFAPASLNTAQAAVQRHVSPFLWDPGDPDAADGAGLGQFRTARLSAFVDGRAALVFAQARAPGVTCPPARPPARPFPCPRQEA
eukprot:jgi/Tetstr1/446369/TSEL_033911.t1